MKNLDSITRSHHVRANVAEAGPSMTPLYQNSAFEAGSRFFYVRNNNPNIEEFEMCVATLEDSKHAVATASGMAAIAFCVNLLEAGAHVVLNRDIYGCSYRAFQRYAKQRGLRLTICDLSVPQGLEAIEPTTRLVFFETPTNPFLKTIPIRSVVEHVRRHAPEALVVVDNTWATPIFQRPITLGADVSLHSATKYFSGHSDVMGGILLTDREDLASQFRDERFYGGAVLAPHSAWLLRRSLHTLDVRIRRQQQTCLRMREVLDRLPQVARVYYPAVDGTQLTGYGAILFFELRSDLTERYKELAQKLTLFGTGTGMAAVTSTVAQPYTGSHASMTDQEKAGIGLGRNLVRLCFGLEAERDLEEQLVTALQSLDR